MLKQTVLIGTFAVVRNYSNITDTKTISLENSTIDVESVNVVCNNQAGF